MDQPTSEFHKIAFGLELTAQRLILDRLEPYSEFHTERDDWKLVPASKLDTYMPPLSQSLPMNYNNGSFEKCAVFSSSSIDGKTIHLRKNIYKI